jgi:hypothetical protein
MDSAEDERCFWSELDALTPSDIGEPLCSRVAAAWLSVALSEHASIASFSRFALELMAVGAPPELLEATHRAALDEIRHARLAFAISSRLSGKQLGPGPLAMPPGAFVDHDRASVTLAAVREGCVAETLAAIEAAEARDRAHPGAIRRALTIIARDEAAHAALSWTFARWALGGAPDALRAAVADALRTAFELELCAPVLVGIDDEAMLAYGRLGEQRRRDVRARAVEQVLKPAAADLLAGGQD